jgi:hypothetical protein
VVCRLLREAFLIKDEEADRTTRERLVRGVVESGPGGQDLVAGT